MSAGRERLPVVLKGKHFAPWVNTEIIHHIYLYRYDPSASPPWEPIPFQVDKRRKVNVVHSMFASKEDFPTIDPGQIDDICVFSYFKSRYCDIWVDEQGEPPLGVRECPITYGMPFDSDLLGEEDEIVFMAADLGSDRDDCPYTWLEDDPENLGSLHNERMEIFVTDDANQDGTIDDSERFWIYAYLWTSTPPPDKVSNAAAPDYTADGESCDPCSGAETSSNQFNEDCGVVKTPLTSMGEGLELHMKSNWVVDDFQIVESTTNDDILEIFGYKTGPEDTFHWDCLNYPRPLGVKVAQTGQVRFIRGVQGAASGYATRKYDKVYNTVYEREVELRVHEISDLQLKQGHNQAVKDDPNATVWVERTMTEENTFYDPIDAMPPSKPDPNADDWTQMMDSGRGGTTSILYEDPSRGPLDAQSRTYYYMDIASAPFGEFGRKIDEVSCMQDGTYFGVPLNDGGCGEGGLDPESPELLFKRLQQVVIPMAAANETLPANVRADDWEYAVLNPLDFGSSGRQQNGSTCDSAPPLCTPSLTASPDGEGAVDLSANIGPGSGCDGVADGFGITRQIASGLEVIIGHTGSGGAALDLMTVWGQPHTYRVFAISSDGRISPKSSPVTVTPADTEAPPPPFVTGVEPIDSGAIAGLEPCSAGDGFIMNMYVSETSGGPYSQANNQPIYVTGPKEYTISGLQNGLTYYVVMTLVDHAGNESDFSAEVSAEVP